MRYRVIGHIHILIHIQIVLLEISLNSLLLNLLEWLRLLNWRQVNIEVLVKPCLCLCIWWYHLLVVAPFYPIIHSHRSLMMPYLRLILVVYQSLQWIQVCCVRRQLWIRFVGQILGDEFGLLAQLLTRLWCIHYFSYSRSFDCRLRNILNQLISLIKTHVQFLCSCLIVCQMAALSRRTK